MRQVIEPEIGRWPLPLRRRSSRSVENRHWTPPLSRAVRPRPPRPPSHPPPFPVMGDPAALGRGRRRRHVDGERAAGDRRRVKEHAHRVSARAQEAQHQHAAASPNANAAHRGERVGTGRRDSGAVVRDFDEPVGALGVGRVAKGVAHAQTDRRGLARAHRRHRAPDERAAVVLGTAHILHVIGATWRWEDERASGSAHRRCDGRAAVGAVLRRAQWCDVPACTCTRYGDPGSSSPSVVRTESAYAPARSQRYEHE